MRTVKLNFTLTLSPLMEEVETFRIATEDIKANLNRYATDQPNVYTGEIQGLFVIGNTLDVSFIILGIPGQQCKLDIQINDKPLSAGTITAIAGVNHRAVCNNNNGQGYTMP